MMYAAKTIKNFLRHIFRAVGFDIIRYQNDNLFEKVVTLKPKQKNAIGDVLISYILESFLLKEGQDLPTTHTHFSESVQIVNTFLELGYAVDVIDYRNKIFVPG